MPVMSLMLEAYRVFITSPSDLPEERVVATQTIHDWNDCNCFAESTVLLPVKWETHAVPQFSDRPQAVINRQLVNDCEILLGMFWTKLGTDTGVAESGTVEEIEQFVAAGKPALLYFSNRPIAPDKINPDQHQKLREFHKETCKKALVGRFCDLDELRGTLLRDLTSQVRVLRSSNAKRTENQEQMLPHEILAVLSAAYPGYHRAVVNKGTVGRAWSRDEQVRKPSCPHTNGTSTTR